MSPDACLSRAPASAVIFLVPRSSFLAHPTTNPHTHSRVYFLSCQIFQEAGYPDAADATGVAIVLGLFKLLMTGERGRLLGLLLYCPRGLKKG